MDGYKKRTQAKMEKIELSTIKLLSLPINDIKIMDIAKLANVSQVSIYNYYGSKEALLKAAFLRVMDQQYEVNKQLFSSDLSFQEKLKEVFLMKKKGASTFNLETYTLLIKNDVEFRDKVVDFTMNKSAKLFLSLIEEGRSLGLVHSFVHNETLLMYLQVLSQAFINVDSDTTVQFQSPDVIDDIMNLFMYGFVKHEGSNG